MPNTRNPRTSAPTPQMTTVATTLVRPEPASPAAPDEAALVVVADSSVAAVGDGTLVPFDAPSVTAKPNCPLTG